MKINGVGIANGINTYNANKKINEKSEAENLKDKLEISKVGKSLSAYSLQDKFLNEKERAEKIDLIKSKIQKGNYNVDSKLVAEKLISAMKEKF